MSPLMLPAILTGLALFQAYLLAGVGRPVWGLVLAHTLVAVPYVMRTTLAVLQISTAASRRPPPCWAPARPASSSRSPCR